MVVVVVVVVTVGDSSSVCILTKLFTPTAVGIGD